MIAKLLFGPRWVAVLVLAVAAAFLLGTGAGVGCYCGKGAVCDDGARVVPLR